MKYLFIIGIFIVTLSGSTVAGKTYDQQVDENISNPPTQEMIKEMRLKTGYMKAQQDLMEAVAAYYYAKGWRQGWDGCSRQHHAHEGVSRGEREKQLGRKFR